MDRFEVTIAGAGVIGLALAHAFTRSGRFQPEQILLVEQETVLDSTSAAATAR
jgi:2-polyprenyl-6-methoxyphenol hydroxylase-like FAD-dependent oxidoreductase